MLSVTEEGLGDSRIRMPLFELLEARERLSRSEEVSSYQMGMTHETAGLHRAVAQQPYNCSEFRGFLALNVQP